MHIKYSPEECVPHSGNMVLLDRLVSVGDETLTAELTVRADGLFDSDGQVPAYLGIEYMAQAIAAFAGYHALEENRDVKLGFLLGTRRYICNVSHFNVGAKLEIKAERLLNESNGLAAFSCTIYGDNVQVSANLNVFQPDNIEQYLQEQK